jgi:N-acetylglucosamine malate deacetylase 1
LKPVAVIFAPHADDESIGCGGTLARLVHQGWALNAVLMTRGAMQARVFEYKAAANLLKISRTHNLDFEEQHLVCNPDTVQRVFRATTFQKPHLILAPHAREWNRDHRCTHQVARGYFEMLRLTNERPLPCFFAYEIWSPIAQPDLLVDITEWLDRKEAAISCYRTQLAERDYVSAARALNVYRATMHGKGTGAAEAFKVFVTEGQRSKRELCLY